MFSTTTISKVETVLSLLSNPLEFEKQSITNNSNIEEQVISGLRVNAQ